MSTHSYSHKRSSDIATVARVYARGRGSGAEIGTAGDPYPCAQSVYGRLSTFDVRWARLVDMCNHNL